MSNADIEAVVLLASDYASQRAEATGVSEVPVSLDDMLRAARDYLPPRDMEMLEFMELLRCLRRRIAACCHPSTQTC